MRVGEPRTLPPEGLERLFSLLDDQVLSLEVPVSRRPPDELDDKLGDFDSYLGFEELLAKGERRSGLCERRQG